MILTDQNRSDPTGSDYGSETKLVVERTVIREEIQLPVLTKHSGMYSVPDTAGRGECSNLC
jgi:hypothetical protein